MRPDIRDPAAYAVLWWPLCCIAYLLVVHVMPLRLCGPLLPWAGMWGFQVPHRQQCAALRYRRTKT